MNPVSDPTQEARPLSLHGALEVLENGKILKELEETHKEATAHMRRKGGKAVITLTICYEPAEDGINITADVKKKLPTKARNKTFIYATDDGKTFEDNPHQTELPFPKIVTTTARRAQ